MQPMAPVKEIYVIAEWVETLQSRRRSGGGAEAGIAEWVEILQSRGRSGGGRGRDSRVGGDSFSPGGGAGGKRRGFYNH